MSTSYSTIIKTVFSFIYPFRWIFIIVISLNIIFSFLSVLSISLVHPVFSLIFPVDGVFGDVLIGEGVVSGGGFFVSIKDSFYDFILSLISSGGISVELMLLRLGLIILSVFVLKNIVKYIGSVLNTYFEESVIKSIRDRVFSQLSSLSIDFFNRSRTGDLMSIITNDISVLNSSTIAAFNVAFREFFQVLMYLVLLFTISFKLTLITFIAGGFILIIVRIATKHLKKYAGRIQQAMSDYTSTMSEIISGIRVVKAFSAEIKSIKRFTDDTARYVSSTLKFQKVNYIVPGLSELSAIGALCFVLYQGGVFILSGELSSADLMLFLFSIFAIMAPVSTMIGAITLFQRGFAAAERVFSITDQLPSVVDGSITDVHFDNKIELVDVSFSYGDRLVLKNINLTIEKGKRVAFVGSSGSGKSTLLDLLIRFYDPSSGAILIDGVDIRGFQMNAYRSLFGIVSQETVLFNDTIENNICFGISPGDNVVDATELENATRISNSYDFIMNKEKGFQTFLGDRGINLSGGEKQRVAIARAIIRKPKVLLFDEATSSLDVESEKIVQNSINNSLLNRTAVIVAHRLSTISDCDMIVVFDNGEIVETGTHTELLDKRGYYYNLHSIQMNTQNG